MSSANRFRTNSNKELIEYLKNCGRIKSDLVFTVMCTVDRKHFTTDPNAAYIDGPHIVAEGKTLSSPHMHAVTLQVFADKFDKSKVALDIGYGTGYLATCMALALGENSRVVGIECISKFQNMAEDIIRKNYATLLINKRLKFLVGDGRLGCSKLGPYDIIHVGAAASNVPQMLIDQLAIGGRLVMPIGETASSQRLTQIDKLSDGTITKKLLMNVVYGDLTNVKHEDIEKQCKYYGKLYEKEKNDSSFNEEVKNIVQKVYEIENNYSKWDKKLTQVEEKLNNLEKNLKIIENENDFSSMKNEMNKKVEKINDRIQIVETGLRTMNNDLINFQNKLTEIMNDKEITQSEKLLEERKESQNINELKKEIEIRDEKLNAITLKITDMETLVSKNQTLSANIIKTMQIKYKELKKKLQKEKMWNFGYKLWKKDEKV